MTRSVLLCVVVIVSGFVASCSSTPRAVVPDGTPRLQTAIESYFRQDYRAALTQAQAAARAAPEDPEPRAWTSEILLRAGDLAAAGEAARRTLALQPCNSVALTVLGLLFSPQYAGSEGANADSAFHYLEEAVRCNPEDGNAWLSLWIGGLAEGRSEGVPEAKARLVDIGFIPPAEMAFGRWLLESTPSEGVLFTNGDWDYIPAAAVQASEGLRRDVLVVCIPLLHSDFYTRRLVLEHGLPKPIFSESSGDDLQKAALETWVDARVSGTLRRPLVVAISASRTLFETPSAELHPAGPGWLVASPGTEPPGIDDLRRGTDRIPPGAFAGPLTAPADRSPIRRASTPPADYVAWAISQQASVISGRPEREWMTKALQGLVEAGVLSPEMRRGVEKYIASLRQGPGL